MAEAVKIPLSSFILRSGIFLTFKWTADQEKILYLGADKVYHLKTLSFIVNFKYEHFFFRLEIDEASKKGKFIQDENGEFEIDINRDISIDGYTESVGIGYPYIKSNFSRIINGEKVLYERYIPIKHI